MLILKDDIRSSSLNIMLRQIVFLLSAVTVTLALGNGYPFQTKKNDFQQTQFSPALHAQAPQAQAAPSPYSFGYEGEGSARQESADTSGKVTGSYKVINEDGTIRVVNYVADEQGFRAEIDTNEAGTKTSNPSNVDFKSAFVEPPAPVAAAAPKKYAANGHFEQKPIQSNGGNNGAYSFNYEALLGDGGSSARRESGDGSGSVTGYYSLSTSDGRKRQVDYSSGAQGFQAKIDTNEFGTKSESPAHVQFFSSASQQEAGPAPSAYAQTGSFQQQQQDKPSPYSFNYNALLEDGSSSRTESSDGSGKVVGSYSLATADGRQRTIDYEADHAGFRAKVNTNEFGTKSDSPADAQFYSSAPQEAPEFKAAGQNQKTSATSFPLEQSKLYSNGQIMSTFQSHATSSSNQFKSSFQGQQGEQPVYEPSPYAFNYEADASGGSSARKESSDASGKVTGSYTVLNADGSMRVVEYEADHNGFRANVKTNELGTKSDNPADVMIKSDAPAAAPSASVRQQQQQQSFASKANFPDRTYTQKSSMVNQQHVGAWSR